MSPFTKTENAKLVVLEDEVSKLVNAMRALNLVHSDPLPSLTTLAGAVRWVAWREEDKLGQPTIDGVCVGNPDEKPKKVPWAARGPGRRGSSTDPRTWGTRDEAERRLPKLLGHGNTGGVGIQLGWLAEMPRYALCGLDLDSCRDPETGLIEPWASEVLERFPSRAEISPSEKGLKVLFLLDRETWAEATRRLGGNARKAWSRGKHCEIALDLDRRFYTVTDQLI
jgi:hypothetical protein